MGFRKIEWRPGVWGCLGAQVILYTTSGSNSYTAYWRTSDYTESTSTWTAGAGCVCVLPAPVLCAFIHSIQRIFESLFSGSRQSHCIATGDIHTVPSNWILEGSYWKWEMIIKARVELSVLEVQLAVRS